MRTQARLFVRILSLGMMSLAAFAQAPSASPQAASTQKAELSAAERELIELSKKKWLLMAAKDVKALDRLFDEKATFVHMGGSMSKAEEIRVIENGRIEYKQADIEDVSVQIIGDTAIVLSRIQLFALVGGNEARNPFSVTETFVRRAGDWKLVALAFTRRMTPQGVPAAPARE
jgi:ketosteroid isomerase-like protein